MTLLAFVLLELSICSVWLSNLSFPLLNRSVQLWVPLFIAAIASGMVAGILAWPAVAALSFLTMMAWATQHQFVRAIKAIFTAITILMALAIALHRLPGFSNPIIVEGARLTADASAYTLYANFDKGAAGLILLVFFAPRVKGMSEFRHIALPTILWAVVTTTAVIGIALAVGYVKFEPKLPAFTPMFLAINLLFVCVAEEALFRGFVQERLSRVVNGCRYLAWLPIAISAVLFGAAHVAGGSLALVFATFAGLGYALSYFYTRKIETAIFVHFMLNAVHFTLFTYPSLVR